MFKKNKENQLAFKEEIVRISEFQRFRRIFFNRGVVVFGLVVIVAFLLTALFAAWISPYSPYEQHLDQVLSQPSGVHLLGTDAIGRDTLSRIIYGTRTSLLIAISAISTATIAGMAAGLFAGYFGGWVQMVIMRFVDTLMTFPMILLAMVIAAMLGGGMKNVIVALGISLLPVYARLMCGQVISVRENDYVMAERTLGSSNMRIMFRHILPNCLPPLIVQITMMMGMTILAEAGLSFLGIGIEAPTAAWGSMVSDGYQYLLSNPILSFAPGFTIMLVVFSFNMVGDGLRDALDPRLRGIL
jgi:peptide/nickel transport system permease protein